MSRAEELILKSKRMLLMEPVLPFAEIKLAWMVNHGEENEKEVDLLHCYSVDLEEDYVGMQVEASTCLPYDMDVSMLNAREDLIEKDPTPPLYQVRIPIPSYVKEGEIIRLYYSYPGKEADYEHFADYHVANENVTVAVIGHMGITTDKTEQEAEDLFVKLTDETFAL